MTRFSVALYLAVLAGCLNFNEEAARARSTRFGVQLVPCGSGPACAFGCCANGFCVSAQATTQDGTCGVAGAACRDCRATGRVCSASRTCCLPAGFNVANAQLECPQCCSGRCEPGPGGGQFCSALGSAAGGTSGGGTSGGGASGGGASGGGTSGGGTSDGGTGGGTADGGVRVGRIVRTYSFPWRLLAGPLINSDGLFLVGAVAVDGGMGMSVHAFDPNDAGAPLRSSAALPSPPSTIWGAIFAAGQNSLAVLSEGRIYALDSSTLAVVAAPSASTSSPVPRPLVASDDSSTLGTLGLTPNLNLLLYRDGGSQAASWPQCPLGGRVEARLSSRSLNVLGRLNESASCFGVVGPSGSSSAFAILSLDGGGAAVLIPSNVVSGLAGAEAQSVSDDNSGLVLISTQSAISLIGTGDGGPTAIRRLPYAQSSSNESIVMTLAASPSRFRVAGLFNASGSLSVGTVPISAGSGGPLFDIFVLDVDADGGVSNGYIVPGSTVSSAFSFQGFGAATTSDGRTFVAGSCPTTQGGAATAACPTPGTATGFLLELAAP